MTDIRERLRERLKHEAINCDNPPIIGYTGDGRLLGDADAEIERLQRVVDEWMHHCNELEAENERLRTSCQNWKAAVDKNTLIAGEEIERLKIDIERLSAVSLREQPE